MPGRHSVNFSIRNTENVEEKFVAISWCRQLKPGVLWGVLARVIQSNSSFGLNDRPEAHLDHVSMPTGNGRVKTKRRFLDVMSDIKCSIVRVKPVQNSLAYALIIAMVRVNGDPTYQLYKQGKCLN